MIDWELEGANVARMEGEITNLEIIIKRETKYLESAEVKAKAAQDAQEILQRIAQAVQQKVHQQISKVVSSCLETVFDDPYEFTIEFERKRGKTEASLRFVREGKSFDPLSSSGGGAVDVAAFALRVACLVLHRPRLSKVVILDEPFRFVSAQYRDKVRAMLDGLSEDMGVQIIQVTHSEELSTGKIIEI